MANATVSRVGSNAAGGGSDDTALFLKVFSGEVLASFNEENKFLARTMTRSITSGKSAQFPVISKTSAQYHTPGAEIVGQQIGHAERVVTIDSLLISDHFLASVDDAMNHFDVRSEYSFQAGRSIANALDKRILQLARIASRASANLDGSPGVASPAGQEVVEANADTDADALVGAIFDAIQILDENDVPSEDRFIAVTPGEFYRLIEQGSKVINRDYGGAGSIAGGDLPRIGGAELVMTNNLQNGTNVDDAGGTKYDIDLTNSVAVVAHRSAVATVKLMDLASEVSWDPRRQGWLLLAKMLHGSDYLRPEAAVEILTVASA